MAHRYELLKSDEVIRREDEHLMKRREQLNDKPTDKEQFRQTKFGIALSGGGIRSATINLGFLKTLNQFGVLRQADYLSTVSGGGYTGAYIQAALRQDGRFDQLFKREQIEYLRSRGAYMIPGKGWWKSWNALVLTIGFIISLLMSWLSPAIVIVLLYLAYVFISKLLNFDRFEVFNQMFSELGLLWYGFLLLLGVFVLHTISNLILRYNVGISRKFNNLETGLGIVGVIWLVIYFVSGLPEQDWLVTNSPFYNGLFVVLLIILGFFANPNALSFHRFYRNQLADAFLHNTGKYKNARLRGLLDADQPNNILAPYPLINTCLNLQSTDDPKFKGAKANDYFLLSPLYCGSKLTNYVSTKDAPDYRDMTLPAATTISAAAVNPGMGMYSNKLLSVFMTLFNARLGFWIANPVKLNKSSIVWWPTYFFYELFSQIGTNNRMLNISDGGHIENLGVYELLRRKCRLIIAVDAGADPNYDFSDLENLTIRVRNELGLEIRFPKGERPEDIIRPKPSHGYSEKRFTVAEVYQLWEEIVPEDEQGNPIVDKNGEPIEVLINYKSVRDALNRLSPDEKQELKYALDTLQLSNYIGNVLESVRNENVRESIYQKFELNYNVQDVFETLIDVFDDIKKVLEATLEKKLDDPNEERRVLRKIIEAIDQRARNFLKVSTLVYVKSSVVAPERKLKLVNKNSLEYQTYKYKVYHPAFPHEPTSDQFFDEVQWESYYRLGQYIGANVLNVRGLLDYFNGKKQAPRFTIDELLWHFDERIDLFQLVPQELTFEKATPPPPAETEKVEAPAARGAEPTTTPEQEVPADTLPADQDTIRNTASDPELDQIEEAEDKIVVGGEEDYSM